MIWGDILQIVNAVHERFFEKFPLSTDSDDFGFSRQIFPFPKSNEIQIDYHWNPSHCDLRSALHPVYRYLVEGPLSPNENVLLDKKSFVHAVMHLEHQWIQHLVQQTPEWSPLQEMAVEFLHTEYNKEFEL